MEWDPGTVPRREERSAGGISKNERQGSKGGSDRMLKKNLAHFVIFLRVNRVQ